MKTGLTVSSIAHAALIALVVVGVGFGRPVEPPPVESIAVDLVPIEEFSNIRLGSLESTIVETDTPSVVNSETPAELARPTGNTQEDQPTPEDSDIVTPAPTKQTAPSPPPQAEPDPVPEPTPEPEPAAPEPAAAAPVSQPEPEPEPAPEPKPEPAPVATPEAPVEPTNVAPTPRMRTAAIDQKRAEFKKLQEEQAKKAAEDKKKAEDEKKKKAEEEKKKKEEEAKRKAAEEKKRVEQAKASQDNAAKLADEVANIINNEQSRGATTGEGGQATLGKETGRSARLSQSQIDGLVAQIRGCINMPPGAEENNSTAELQFSIDGSGNVVGQPQLLQSSDDTYARAVSRAVMRCGPYMVVANEVVRAQFRAREF